MTLPKFREQPDILELVEYQKNSSYIFIAFRDFTEFDWKFNLDLSIKKWTNEDIDQIYQKLKQLVILINGDPTC